MRGQASSVGAGAAFGAFGELLQCALPENDLDFMVTFPISRWTVATFRRTGAGEPLVVTPVHKDKSRRLAEFVMREYGGGHGGILSLDSDLPEVRLRERLGFPPPLTIVVHDEGGEVDTLRFSQLPKLFSRRQDFAALSRICQEAGGLGLVVTHSGTALGLLLSDNDSDCASKVQYSMRACAALPGSVSVMQSLSVADHDRRLSLHRAVTSQGTPQHALS
jgi:uncharacterized protein involved in propanediol utilization